MSDHETVLALARAAEAALDANRARLDDLNVYPVPDGDTGTNMLLTARAVVEALEDGDDDVTRPPSPAPPALPRTRPTTPSASPSRARC